MNNRKRDLIEAVHKANVRGDKAAYEALLKELGAFVYATERLPNAYPIPGNPYQGA